MMPICLPKQEWRSLFGEKQLVDVGVLLLVQSGLSAEHQILCSDCSAALRRTDLLTDNRSAAKCLQVALRICDRQSVAKETRIKKKRNLVRLPMQKREALFSECFQINELCLK